MTQLTVEGRTPTPGALLDRTPEGPMSADPHLWGFGGLHGGLVLARLTHAMQRAAPGGIVRSTTARFHRAIRDDWEIAAAVTREGRTLTTTHAVATTGRGTHVDASAVLTTQSAGQWQTVAPAMPDVPDPDALAVFTIPVEFVPWAAHTQVRPATTNLPYSGADQPELLAWVRLTEDDRPPDLARLILLMDSLAPSYAALLTDLVHVPTIELTVVPSEGLTHASSPWVLLQATTRSATAAGWIDELLDAWGPDGSHLGTAHQLRVATTS